jgi:hypothetical protein
MMHCPFCKKSAHARTSRYLSENVKQRYHQCTNIECSATFRTTEAIDEVIRPPAEKTPPVAEPVTPRHPVKCRAATARHTVINQGELTMTTLTLQQAFEACQKNETAWLNRKAELAAAEQEYQEQVLAGDDRIPGRMQTLRDIIDVKKWEINQAAGRYIRSHEAVQRISIRNRLNDFMQAHGTELAATLAPELMGLSQQPALLTGHALDRSAHYLREALSVWLSTGEEINYSAEDSDILTAIGFRPDAASRVDNQEKYTPAQSLIYARRRTELAGR